MDEDKEFLPSMFMSPEVSNRKLKEYKEGKRSHLSAPMVGKYPRLMGNV